MDNNGDINYQYMHLVPTGTMEPMGTDFGDEKFEIGGRVNFGTAMDFSGMLSNLWTKASNAYKQFVNILDDNDSNLTESDDLEQDSTDSNIGFGLSDIFDSFANFWDTDFDDDDVEDEDDSDYLDLMKVDSVDNDEEIEPEEQEQENVMNPEENQDADAVADKDKNKDEVEDEDKAQDKEIESNADSEYVYNEKNDEFIVAKDNIFAKGTQSAAEEEAESIATEEKHDLVIVEMSIIILFIIICGVLYAGYRFLLQRREKKREMDYYNINATSPL